MRKLLIALVAALLVIALLAAPVMAQEPGKPAEIPVPAEAGTGMTEANENSADQAPELVLDRV